MNSDSIVAIIVNYNGIDYTRDCIHSIHLSSIVPHIVVVDNGSDDYEIETMIREFPDINLIANGVNKGFSYANNLGIRWALDHGYKYVMLLNNDTIVDRDMVCQLLEYVSVSVITVPSMFYYTQPDMVWYGGGYIDKKTGNAKHRHKNETIRVDNMEPEECTFATGCCMLIDVNALKRIGFFEEKFFMYCEDTEFCIRAINNGISIKYVPRAKLWHRVGASSGGSDSFFSTYYMTRNRLICIDMHKDFFCWSAKIFTIVTRRIRALICKDERIKESFTRGINDYKSGISGKVIF